MATPPRGSFWGYAPVEVSHTFGHDLVIYQLLNLKSRDRNFSKVTPKNPKAHLCEEIIEHNKHSRKVRLSRARMSWIRIWNMYLCAAWICEVLCAYVQIFLGTSFVVAIILNFSSMSAKCSLEKLPIKLRDSNSGMKNCKCNLSREFPC